MDAGCAEAHGYEPHPGTGEPVSFGSWNCKRGVEADQDASKALVNGVVAVGVEPTSRRLSTDALYQLAVHDREGVPRKRERGGGSGVMG